MILHPVTRYSSFAGVNIVRSIELELLQKVNEPGKICLKPTSKLEALCGLDDRDKLLKRIANFLGQINVHRLSCEMRDV